MSVKLYCWSRHSTLEARKHNSQYVYIYQRGCAHAPGREGACRCGSVKYTLLHLLLFGEQYIKKGPGIGSDVLCVDVY